MAKTKTNNAAIAKILYDIAYTTHYPVFDNGHSDDKGYCCISDGCDSVEDVTACPWMQTTHYYLIENLKHYQAEARKDRARARAAAAKKRPRTQKDDLPVGVHPANGHPSCSRTY